MVLIALDQVTKVLVRAHIPLLTSVPENGWIRFTHITNDGGVFGMFPGHVTIFSIMTIIGIVVLLIFYCLYAINKLLLSIGLACILAGSIGNLIDRLSQGYVTDFIDTRIWAIFNIADASGVIGVVLIIYYLLTLFVKKEKSNPA